MSVDAQAAGVRDGRQRQGVDVWANGDYYVGEIKDGEATYTTRAATSTSASSRTARAREGTLTWADGDKYVGEFKDGKKHGLGKFIADGQVAHDGEWENGQPKK